MSANILSYSHWIFKEEIKHKYNSSPKVTSTVKVIHGVFFPCTYIYNPTLHVYTHK